MVSEWIDDDIPTIDYDEMHRKHGQTLVLKDDDNCSVLAFHSDDDIYYILSITDEGVE